MLLSQKGGQSQQRDERTEEEKQDAHKFAARVRSVMAEASGLPQTEHALADFFLMKSAQKFGTQPHPTSHPEGCPAMPCGLRLYRSRSRSPVPASNSIPIQDGLVSRQHVHNRCNDHRK